MKKAVLILIVLLLMVSAVYAVDFSVLASPVTDKIDLSESAKFTLSITNDGASREFKIRSMAHPYWEVYTEPFMNPITLEVDQGETKSIDIFVRPVHVSIVDTYQVNLKVEADSGNQDLNVPLKIGIKSSALLIEGYVPTVTVDLDMQKQIDPRKDINIRLNLDNQNPLDYPTLKIIFESNLIKDEIVKTLGPNEEKTIELKKNIDPLTPPQGDALIITLIRENRTIERVVTKIEIEEYIEKSESIDKGFLKQIKKITLLSNNPNYKGQVKAKVNIIDSLFSSSKPRAKLVTEKDGSYLTWDVIFDGKNKIEIYTTESYRIVLFILVLLAVAGIMYIQLRSPLILTKSSTDVKISEGGISEIHVRINIKNREKEKVESLNVSDAVPSIVDIERGALIGTIQPTKILKHDKKGWVIRWEIGSLEPNEERVITYKLKSKLSILGELKLPAATATYNFKGKGEIAMSNILMVGA